MHVRPAGEEAGFAVTFETWDAGAKADDWIDKAYLALDESEVTRVELSGVVLQRDGNALEVADLGEGEEANAEKANALLDRLVGLRIYSVFGNGAKTEYLQDEPGLEVKVTRDDSD